MAGDDCPQPWPTASYWATCHQKSLTYRYDGVVTGEARRARPESPARARARPGVTVSTAGPGPGPGLGPVRADDGPATSLSWGHSVKVSRVT